MSHVKFNPINDYNIQNLVCLIFAKLAKQAKPSYIILESNLKNIMFNLMSHVKFNPINDYNIQNLVCLIFAKLAKQAKPSYIILESNNNFVST